MWQHRSSSHSCERFEVFITCVKTCLGAKHTTESIVPTSLLSTTPHVCLWRKATDTLIIAPWKQANRETRGVSCCCLFLFLFVLRRIIITLFYNDHTVDCTMVKRAEECKLNSGTLPSLHVESYFAPQAPASCCTSLGKLLLWSVHGPHLALDQSVQRDTNKGETVKKWKYVGKMRRRQMQNRLKTVTWPVSCIFASAT